MVSNFLKFLQYEKRYSDHTITAYQKDLQQFHEFLLDTFEISDDSDVKHPHLRSWVVHLVECDINPKSINRKIATLKSYFKFLQAREFTDHNPATRLKPLKTDKPLPSFVQEGEMVMLLDQMEFTDDFQGVRDRLIIEMFYATGIRLSELINLKDSDINFHERSVKVLGKRNKERVIPVPDSVVNNIRTYQHMRSDFVRGVHAEFFFITDSVKKLYPMMVYRLIRKYLGFVTTISKKSPHILRHTFATHLLDKGADLNAVKDLLGHTSLAATQVYTHNSLEKLKSTFDQAHPKA